MIEIVLAAALHLGGDFIPDAGSGHQATVHCGPGTTESPASGGGQECVPTLTGGSAPVATAPTTTVVTPTTVVTQPLYTVGYGYGGFGSRPFFPFHVHNH